MMTSKSDLPNTHRALVVTSISEPLKVQSLPIPQVTTGSAIVRILSAGVLSYAREIYTGKRQYPFPTPLVAGTSAVGRIVTVGPDATLLKPGDLVHVDCTIRGRDDPTAIMLSGISDGFSEGSKKLMSKLRYQESCIHHKLHDSFDKLEREMLTSTQKASGEMVHGPSMPKYLWRLVLSWTKNAYAMTVQTEV